MTGMVDAVERQYLTVEEAALMLGTTRLRLREAAARGLIPSKRDNNGRLRLDLSNHAGPLDAESPLDPSEMLDLLFDEVEELQSDLQTRDADIASLTALAARQAEALDRADMALAAEDARMADMTRLLDRTLAHLEEGTLAREKLAALSARTLDLLEQTGDRLEVSMDQSARLAGQVARALDAAEAEPGTARIGETADRAIALLDTAISRAEAGEVNTTRTGDMLTRALDAGERLEQDLAQRDAAIEKQKETLDSALAVSERAIALAGGTNPKVGFWRRLLGL